MTSLFEIWAMWECCTGLYCVWLQTPLIRSADTEAKVGKSVLWSGIPLSTVPDLRQCRSSWQPYPQGEPRGVARKSPVSVLLVSWEYKYYHSECKSGFH